MDWWTVAVAVLMVVATAVSFVPFIPGPALVWAIGVVYAIVTEFQEIGLPTVIAMTVLMIIGSTADWWTRMFGLNSEGSLSCGTLLVSTVGAIAGTFFIPIPVLGTVLGAAAGVMALVFYQEESWEKAFIAARGIMGAWIASFFVEFLMSIIIVVIFLRALFDGLSLF
jgi:uncharacterized protein YqgC (DUF456 family)